MANPVKLTEEELKKITELQNKYATVTAQLGQLKLEQIILNSQVDKLKELELQITKDYMNTQAEEETFATEITAKYGNGDINLETGEFNPAQ